MTIVTGRFCIATGARSRPEALGDSLWVGGVYKIATTLRARVFSALVTSLAMSVYSSTDDFVRRTSKKPDMKFLGSLAPASSSVLKYFMICVSCFQ